MSWMWISPLPPLPTWLGTQFGSSGVSFMPQADFILSVCYSSSLLADIFCYYRLHERLV